VTDSGDNNFKELDSNGNILMTVPVGKTPSYPAFDSRNWWVPNTGDNSLTVVRARDGLVLKTLFGNGMTGPVQAAFDGRRIIVMNPSGNSVSLWKATDLSMLGSVSTGMNTTPTAVCWDRYRFWLTLEGINKLARE